MSAKRTTEPRVLTISFVGGAAGAGACGVSNEAHLAESASAVAVLVSAVATPGPSSSGAAVAFAAIGYVRRLTITLRDRLGARVVVDAQRHRAIRVDP
ncbi:MAG TPA: hypothetical protein VH914_15265 [Acidimicrobiia bacterium]|nr:hypothetical protein [Acidimicrobiia bacterium]